MSAQPSAPRIRCNQCGDWNPAERVNCLKCGTVFRSDLNAMEYMIRTEIATQSVSAAQVNRDVLMYIAWLLRARKPNPEIIDRLVNLGFPQANATEFVTNLHKARLRRKRNGALIMIVVGAAMAIVGLGVTLGTIANVGRQGYGLILIPGGVFGTGLALLGGGIGQLFDKL